MVSVSRSLITKIKNRKLSITRITAKGLAENLEAAWLLMMDEIPATLGDDWPEEELIPVQAAIVDTEVLEISKVDDETVKFEEAAEMMIAEPAPRPQLNLGSSP